MTIFKHFFLDEIIAATLENNRQNPAKNVQLYICVIPECKVNIPFQTANAVSIQSARKATQKIVATRKFSGIHSNFILYFLLKKRNTQFVIPCKNPQKINVQPAPCQNPLTSITVSRLKYVLASPFRLPPSGI